MQRNIRKQKAQETLDISNKGVYTVNNQQIDIQEQLNKMKAGTIYINADELTTLRDNVSLSPTYNTHIEVTDEDSVSCIHRLAKSEQNIMCLNFASAKNPGGGFLNGAIAQEESLALSSALYTSQLEAENFYKTHRKMRSCVYTDGMIYSPTVPVFRNHAGELIPYNTCNFITSAAVNTGVVKEREPEQAAQIPGLMLERMDKMFALAAHNKLDTLILGAWGCGVFQNDPVVIAQLFKQLLDTKYKNVFKHVAFAVYSNNTKFIDAFRKEFGVN